MEALIHKVRACFLCIAQFVLENIVTKVSDHERTFCEICDAIAPDVENARASLGYIPAMPAAAQVGKSHQIGVDF